MKLASALLLSSLVSACMIDAGDDPAADPDVTTDEVAAPTVDELVAPDVLEIIGAESYRAVAAPPPIKYHGGPIMLGTSWPDHHASMERHGWPARCEYPGYSSISPSRT